jgi:deoxyribodipyrimidine photolyase-related protein
MAEVMEEATSVRHHKKKIAFLFSAMRHFAEDLRDEGFTVDYLCFDARSNPGDFGSALAEAVQRHDATRVVMTEPSEVRVLEAARELAGGTRRRISISWPMTRFLASHEDFVSWATNGKMVVSRNPCGWSISTAKCAADRLSDGRWRAGRRRLEL